MQTDQRQTTWDKQRGLLQVVHGRRVRLDRRTKIAQRATRLRAHYFALLEQAGRDVQSVELIAAVDRAAELQAISEHLRADALRGRAVFDDLVRVERVAVSALRALRLPSAASKQSSISPLAEYLASTRTADEAAG